MQVDNSYVGEYLNIFGRYQILKRKGSIKVVCSLNAAKTQPLMVSVYLPLRDIFDQEGESHYKKLFKKKRMKMKK